MSKTYKDKANHFLHHLKNEKQISKSDKITKHKYSNEEIPKDVKDLVDILSIKLKGTRYGNNRNYYKNVKVFNRRNERKNENNDLNQEIKKMKI